jgi:hypothetical protein
MVSVSGHGVVPVQLLYPACLCVMQVLIDGLCLLALAESEDCTVSSQQAMYSSVPALCSKSNH